MTCCLGIWKLICTPLFRWPRPVLQNYSFTRIIFGGKKQCTHRSAPHELKTTPHVKGFVYSGGIEEQKEWLSALEYVAVRLQIH